MNDMDGMRTNHHTSRPRRLVGLACLAGVLSVTAAACGSDSDGASATTKAPGTTMAPGTTAAPSGEKATVTKQWARTSPADATAGAAYFTITSPVDDKLTGVMVDASVAKMAQMHETKMSGGMGSGTTMAGATTAVPQMSMSPVDSIELKAGTATELKPGGYHIMLMELAKPLKVGDTITLTLTLAKGGDIKVDVPVLDAAP
jgi:copper(I)-binding protein